MWSGALAALLVSTAAADQVTGQWDFENPLDGFAATVGQPGSIWLRVFDAPTDVETVTEFGTCTSFGIPLLSGGDSGVMKLPKLDQFMGLKMFTNASANGGGVYVNQYSLIVDQLYPTSSSSTWRSFLNTNECNTNDQDLAINPSNGIGISGVYEGAILADTWHRVILSVDLAAAGGPELRKYIDGVLVGVQILGEGVDARWSIYTAADGLPALLFSDNDGDSNLGYFSAVQFRDYAIQDAEAATLGVAQASGIATGTGVSGYWTFDNAADGLAASVGIDLDWFKGLDCGFDEPCPQDLLAGTSFGTTTSFGLPSFSDGVGGVMRFDAAEPCTGYLFPHGAAANGGGLRVNDYTLITDVIIPFDDYFLPPTNHVVAWISIYQSALLNNEDAMYFIRTEDAALGDDGSYADTLGWAIEDRWMRIVAAVNGSDPSGTKLTKYVILSDGTVLGPVTQDEGLSEPVDGKRSLWPASQVGYDHLLMFADDDFETHRGYCSSIQVRDYVMTSEEVAALGGPSAAGIPIPATCPNPLPACDNSDIFPVDGDCIVNLSDLGVVLANFAPGTGGKTRDQGDVFPLGGGDGIVDLSDLGQMLTDFNANCQ